MDHKKELFYREFVNREEEFRRAPFSPEMEFYSTIKSGDLQKTRELCWEPLDEKTGLGTLSANAARNLKYHFVITAAMTARSCIEGGMEYAKAYSISDVYIRQADVLSDPKEISALHRKMCLEYAAEMRRISTHRACSRNITACLNYIYENLHTKITVKQLAAISGLSVSYTSRLFHKETGFTIQEYVLNKKIETSKNMLLFTDRTLAEIALILGFPNQSCWTQAFRRVTGTTPAKFRAQAPRRLNRPLE